MLVPSCEMAFSICSLLAHRNASRFASNLAAIVPSPFDSGHPYWYLSPATSELAHAMLTAARWARHDERRTDDGFLASRRYCRPRAAAALYPDRGGQAPTRAGPRR